jgi:peptide/nickel transport system permease protein
VTGYLVRRLLWGAIVLLTIGVLTFVLAYVAPGDPARAIAGRNASAAAVENIRAALGMNRPLTEQMVGYLGGILRGDFGQSYQLNRPVLDLILERVPATLELAVGGVVIAIGIGVPIGVRSATRRGGRVDRLGLVATSVFVAAPAFLVGYILIYLLAFQPTVRWGISIFPIGEYRPWDLRYLALPALTLGVGLAAYYARLTRTALLDELHQDYVRTARAKGASEPRVVWRHAFRNALPTLLIQLGLDLGILLGGVVLVETVFSWRGVGKLAIDAVTGQDLPLLLGTVLFATVCIVAINLLVDILVAIFDPRITLGGGIR